MKKRLVLLTVFLFTFSLASVLFAEQITREQWLDSFTAALPTAFCQPQEYFMSCFDITQKECEKAALSSTRTCINKVKDDLPEFFDAQSGREWGTKIGACAGSSFEIYFRSKNKFRNTAKCNDVTQWK